MRVPVYMRVPVIMQISHLLVFMKGIVRKNYLKVEIDINHVAFKYILFPININLNVTKSMYFFPKKMYFLSISFIKTNI